MYGRDRASLELQMSLNGDKYQTIWIKSQPQSNNWVQAFVTITIIEQKANRFNLMFKATLDRFSSDTISLDDISLTEGPCPRTDICDFEIGSLCDWTPNGFALGWGQNTKEPMIDHTLGTNLGKYAFTQV